MKKYIFLEMAFLFGLFMFSSIFALANVQLYYIPQAISFLSFLFIPGWIILRNSDIERISIGEFLILSGGISTVLAMLIGLLASIVYPLFGLNKPLAIEPFLITEVLILLPFFLRAYVFQPLTSLPQITITWSVVIGLCGGIFPLLSIIGAQLLNNQQTNSVTVTMLCGIALYVLLLAIFSKKMSSSGYPLALFFISTSLVLMYSLRSWHIFGFDINTELRIIYTTQHFGKWSVNNIADAYNATLSVAILPVIWQFLLHIPTEYVLKLIEPILLSLTPVAIYYTARKYVSGIVAFLASFFFISQFQFMQQLPAITRQEIAFIFFALSLLVFLTDSLRPKVKHSLFILFSVGLVISHYTTAYVACGIFLASAICIGLWNVLAKKLRVLAIPTASFHSMQFLSIFILLLCTYFWYGQYTSTIDYLSNFAKATISSILQEGSSLKSKSAQVAFTNAAVTYSLADTQNYEETAAELYTQGKTKITPYDPTSYASYIPFPTYAQVVRVGNRDIYMLSTVFFNLVKEFMKLASVIGIVYLLVLSFKRKTQVALFYIIMAGIFASIVVGSVVLPFISIAYNIERLYQQALVVLGLPIVLGGICCMFWSKRMQILPMTFLILYYFLFYSGVMNQVIGGGSYLNLNNFGEDYERFYIHDTEVASAQWLDKNWNKVSLIYVDPYAELRLKSGTNISYGFINDVVPPAIDAYSFVYADYANTVLGNARATYNNNTIVYQFPTEFLNENKNLIYTNKQTAVYK